MSSFFFLVEQSFLKFIPKNLLKGCDVHYIIRSRRIEINEILENKFMMGSGDKAIHGADVGPFV